MAEVSGPCPLMKKWQTYIIDRDQIDVVCSRLVQVGGGSFKPGHPPHGRHPDTTTSIITPWRCFEFRPARHLLRDRLDERSPFHLH